MLKEPTIEKLKAMRLEAMVSAWNEQHGKPDVNRLSFDERFGMLVDAEWLHRENRRLGKALREAKLKLASACLEDIEYSSKRELDRAQIRQLASCRWVAEHQNFGLFGTGLARPRVPDKLAGCSPKGDESVDTDRQHEKLSPLDHPTNHVRRDVRLVTRPLDVRSAHFTSGEVETDRDVGVDRDDQILTDPFYGEVLRVFEPRMANAVRANLVKRVPVVLEDRPVRSVENIASFTPE